MTFRLIKTNEFILASFNAYFRKIDTLENKNFQILAPFQKTQHIKLAG